jgi:predicted transcriptional regulator
MLSLSELLPTRSRTFQLARQIALLTQHRTIDRILSAGQWTTDDSRGLARVRVGERAGALTAPSKEVASRMAVALSEALALS